MEIACLYIESNALVDKKTGAIELKRLRKSTRNRVGQSGFKPKQTQR